MWISVVWGCKPLIHEMWIKRRVFLTPPLRKGFKKTANYPLFVDKHLPPSPPPYPLWQY